jgi:hypothetical protein
MGDYKNITKRILSENRTKGLLQKYGNVLYHEDINEIMHPDIEDAILNSQHSLSDCNVFPESEIPFDIILIGDRFRDIVLNGREAFDVNQVDPNDMYMHMDHLFEETIEMEKKNKKVLEELAVKMMMDEFDIPEGVIKFDAELVESIEKPKKKKETEKVMFEDHDELVKGNNEIKKRRIINALVAGAAKNLDHLYHDIRHELKNMNTKLLSNYKKLISADDFLSFIESTNNDVIEGGSFNIVYEADKKNNITPTITARGMAFPILVRELYQGVMEVLSTHGIPKNPKLLEYTMNNADYDEAKPWDEKLGPKMWELFCAEIPKKDLNLKHFVFAKFISKPAIEFIHDLREVFSKTKHGKHIIMEILSEVKKDVEIDEHIKNANDTHFEADDFY